MMWKNMPTKCGFWGPNLGQYWIEFMDIPTKSWAFKGKETENIHAIQMVVYIH